MATIGTIKGFGGTALNLQAWLALRTNDGDFRPIEEVEGRDPFSGERISIPARHGAEIVGAERILGRLWWMEGTLVVESDAPIAHSIAERIAVHLGALFEPAAPVSDDSPPGPMATVEQRMAYLAKMRRR